MKKLKHRVQRWAKVTQAAVKGERVVSAYWYQARNFGDMLTPFLLGRYGVFAAHAAPAKAKVIGVGSILEHLPVSFPGVILGSGFIHPESHCGFREARIMGVRGPLTLRQIGERPGVVLGDPGLLAARSMAERKKKTFKLGIIPHYADKGQEEFRRLAERFGGQVSWIDVEKGPEKVFADIDACECILSSSMHGLIVGDSLGIPTGWLGSARVWGGRHKFDDYYGALALAGEKQHALTGLESLDELLSMATLKPQDRVGEVAEGLDGMFKAFAQRMGAESR